jgi:hypothetical protein
VALAGRGHVVVAVGAEFGGAAGLRRDQGSGGGEGGGLGLLAAEGAAHPPHLDDDLGVAPPEQLRDQMLDLARMLGGAEDMEPALLARRRQRRLAFEVEMLLAAHLEAAGQPVRRRGARCVGIAAAHILGRLDLRAGGLRVGDGDQSRARRDRGLAQPRGAAGGTGAGRRDEEEGLARVDDLVLGQQRLVMDDRADIVFAGYVGGGQHGDDAGRGAHRVQVERKQGGMAFGGMAEGAMEQARRLRQVVDIGGGARDMEVGAVVRQWPVHLGRARPWRRGGAVSHSRPPAR